MSRLFWLLCLGAWIQGEPARISEIKEEAVRDKKYVAVYFCGSDWCRSCLQFKSETLALPEVEGLLRERFVWYTADFPQHKKLDRQTVETNEFLAEKLNPQGIFPVLVIADTEWTVKARILKKEGPQSALEQLKAWRYVHE